MNTCFEIDEMYTLSKFLSLTKLHKGRNLKTTKFITKRHTTVRYFGEMLPVISEYRLGCRVGGTAVHYSCAIGPMLHANIHTIQMHMHTFYITLYPPSIRGIILPFLSNYFKSFLIAILSALN